MEWKPIEQGESGFIKVPERWLHLYYYEALNILFRFENALRIFVYVILKRHLKEQWDTTALGDDKTIRTETKKRIAQARDHGYLGDSVSSPMLFLSSGELAQLITSEAYWKYFAPYFRASRDIVATKLQEIGTVRNSLAHFRPIKPDDVDLIKQNSKHLLIQIEDCLTQITSTKDTVPSNTSDEWYTSIKPLGNEHVNSQFYSSPDANWIRLQITYQMPILRNTIYPELAYFKVGAIRTSQILHKLHDFRKSCIYLSEDGFTASLKDDSPLKASMHISLIFARSTLEERHSALAEEIKTLYMTIESETQLVELDPMAKGEFIEAKSLSARKTKLASGRSYWQVGVTALETPMSKIDIVEYWGKQSQYSTDFISSTHQYPWMPSSVSDEELPF